MGDLLVMPFLVMPFNDIGSTTHVGKTMKSYENNSKLVVS